MRDFGGSTRDKHVALFRVERCPVEHMTETLGRYARRIGVALLRRLGKPGDRLWRAAFLLCGVVAFGTIWLHRYPVGIDLPQHANLFRIWYACLLYTSDAADERSS